MRGISMLQGHSVSLTSRRSGHGTAVESALELALENIHQPFNLHADGEAVSISVNGTNGNSAVHVPAFRLEHLGDPSFCADHGIRFPYLAGAMANGIGSADIVEAMGRAGMLAF